MASVAMNEGIRSRTWARPRAEPGEDADGERRGGRSRSRSAATVERDDDARQRGHRLDRQVDAAEHDDEGDAGGEDEEHGGVAGELEQRRRLRGRPARARRRRRRERRAWRAAATGARRSAPMPLAGGTAIAYTMCPMRSTCCGLWPGAGVGAVGDRAVAHHEDGVAEADRLLERVGGEDRPPCPRP